MLRSWTSGCCVHGPRDVPHLSSLLGPTHTRPPCRGDGLLQERWRSSKPVPQVVLHCPHDDHGVQPPFLRRQNHRYSAALACVVLRVSVSAEEAALPREV